MKKESLICDVTGSTRDVKELEVIVREKGNDSLAPLMIATVDLSPKGQRRLVAFIARGLTRPKVTPMASVRS